MKLTPEQLERFDREGYLFFPALFSPAEIAVLKDEVPRLYAQKRPENVREKGSDAVRTNFAAHMYSRPFAKLARHPNKLGVIDAKHDTSTTSYPLWTIDKDTITKLVGRGGIVAPKGPAGSMSAAVERRNARVRVEGYRRIATAKLSPRRAAPATPSP